MAENTSTIDDDKLATGIFILSVVLPIVGIVFYFIYRNRKHPVKARQAINAALIGIIFWFAFRLFLIFFFRN